MPQKIVPIIEGETYHVFNRGVDKRDIFLDKSDYLRFYQSLNLFNSEEAIVNFDFVRTKVNNSTDSFQGNRLVDIQAYALLPNHFHLIIKSVTESGISEFMRRVGGGYANYFNQKYERSGALFQGSFKRVHIERQEQYQYLFVYVNENQFVHNLIAEREICHSSSLHYQGLAKSKIINMQLDTQYNFDESVILAKSIYEKRKAIKQDKILFE